jgi:hypothetical protein
MLWTMVVTKITKRKRKKPDWLDNEVYPILDLTEDGNESQSVSVSDINSSEDGKRSPARTGASSSFDREILLGDQEEDDLQFPSPAKDSPIAEDLRKLGSYQNNDFNFYQHEHLRQNLRGIC